MNDSSDISRQYTGSTPLDLPFTLEKLQVQYLDDSEAPTLIIFNAAIFAFECIEEEFTSLESAEVSVSESPYNANTDETEGRALSLIESFVEKVAFVEKTTASRQP
ncbi:MULTISPECIES: hypothetical protein [Natrialbaceae]|uniref:hypothetical protein n=1 Tax=Natrialbaceae TaxID=1644061 RepID=UPI00207D2F49|nr:hypothetical protein [Natronococcus sp. CG52]